MRGEEDGVCRRVRLTARSGGGPLSRQAICRLKLLRQLGDVVLRIIEVDHLLPQRGRNKKFLARVVDEDAFFARDPRLLLTIKLTGARPPPCASKKARTRTSG
jgi:hypothetical protein